MDGHGNVINGQGNVILSQDLNVETLFQTLNTHTESKRFWVAFSGGMDSHVLLQLCFQAFKNKPDYHLGALHVHHGLSENADHWAKHCEVVCQELALPFSVLWVDAKVYDGGSPEEAAREARFKAFEQFLQENECLLMAHHAEDQAETILLRLFRGTGPLGMGGMPAVSNLGKGKLIRPLLSVSKEAVLAYAKENNLKWIEDESNQNLRFDRNFLRHSIFPHLKARWPRVVRSVSRAGALCLETATAVQVLASNDFKNLQAHQTRETYQDRQKQEESQEHFKAEKIEEDEKIELTLSVAGLLKLPEARRRGVIRHWLQALKLALPSLDHMERIDREIIQARIDAHPRLKIGDYEITREKGELKVRHLVSEKCFT